MSFLGLILLISVSVCALLMFVAERRGQQRLQNWLPLPGGRKRLRDDLTVLLTTVAVFATLLSSAPIGTEDSIQNDAPTLVLAVDVSPSMSATDVIPTRLDRVKAEIRQLATALPGATFALLPFAGEAVEQLPLTNDQDALLFFVDQLAPGMVAAPGSAPAAAALRGQQLLTDEVGDTANSSDSAKRSGTVILFSDGERTLPGPVPTVLTTIPIHVVPLGSIDGSPFLDRNGKTHLTKDNQPQLSRAQPEFLTDLAKRSGGSVYPPATGTFALASLTEQWERSSPNQSPTPPELFLWLALGCWLVRYLVIFKEGRQTRTTVTCALLLLGVISCRVNEPQVEQRESGYHAYQAGELAVAAQHYAEAVRKYDGPERAAALRDQGTLLLLDDKGRQAVAILEISLLENPQDEITRTNLALALRLPNSQEAGATGSGEGESQEQQGASLSREQALKLIENVKPRTLEDAPLTDVTIREIPVERDW